MLSAALTAFLISSAVMGSEPTTISSMDAFTWRNRPVLVFAPQAGHSLLVAQRAAIAGRSDGMRDRDIVVIEVAGDSVTIDGKNAPNLSAGELRTRYRLRPTDAAALLVGKDGGVKLRESHALSVQTLFETIDAMPMRRHEMRR